MFDLFSRSHRDCSGVSRRDFLRIGGLSALGLTLADFLRAKETTAASAWLACSSRRRG